MIKFYVQLAAIVGTSTNDEKRMVNNKAYAMCMKNPEGNKGIREPRLHKHGGATPTFEFNTEVERDNFINYLASDFARFCLSFLKNNQHLENGELELVPYFDFTQEWDDEKLFKHFNINEETQNYIKNFLPDFHKIRKDIS